MDEITFEAALNGRVEQMLDACIKCGKCVVACPSVEPAGISDANPVDVITGIIDIVRSGTGGEASREWSASGTLSGACIKACDYGVNPRFRLAMARASVVKATKG